MFAQSKFPGFGLVEPRIQLEFENLGMRLQHKDKVVLQGVSGEERSRGKKEDSTWSLALGVCHLLICCFLLVQVIFPLAS